MEDLWPEGLTLHPQLWESHVFKFVEPELQNMMCFHMSVGFYLLAGAMSLF